VKNLLTSRAPSMFFTHLLN